MNGSPERCTRTPDASLYVLGELRGLEQESFARHLGRCEECAEEVELLEQVADAVPLLSSQQTPAPDEEPRLAQRPPTLAVAAANARAVATATRPQSETPAGRPVLRPIQGGAAAARSSRPARGSSRRRLLKTPMPRPTLIGLLALGVLAIATVALNRSAPSSRYVRIRAGWSLGGAALKLQGNSLQLLVEAMPKPASGTGYQVWVLRPQGLKLTPTKAWLHLNEAGEAGVTVPGDYHQWLAVAVYTEPLHGPDTTRSGAAVVGDLRNLR